MELFNLCIWFWHWNVFDRLPLRVSIGSTGKATSTPSSLPRWRSDHPTLGIWKEEGNARKGKKKKTMQLNSTPTLPISHCDQMPPPGALLRSTSTPWTFLPPAGETVKTNVICPKLLSKLSPHIFYSNHQREKQYLDLIRFWCFHVAAWVGWRVYRLAITSFYWYADMMFHILPLWRSGPSLQIYNVHFLWLMTFRSL